jgi:hypothetical protein
MPLQAAATAIDLTAAPTRESAGFAPGTGSRVWMNPARAPFDVTVALPGGRVYHARAEMAVMLSSARAGDPDRLTVQLPPAGLDTVARLIGEYAAQWGFPATAAEAWRVNASQDAPGDRHYSTHVFTADDIGFVHLEFQVSHHQPERDFVVAALFSWHDHAA